jgi:uncharacterized repeat protein (TIGR04138 family)
MHAPNLDEVLDQIVLKDARYHRDAYLFVREALDYTQKTIGKSPKSEPRQGAADDSAENRVRHVSGQELLLGIRGFALEQFGPMTLMLLQEWGVKRCEDFGEIVFNMVENNLLAKTKSDSRDDFRGGYEFEEAFRKPFLPSQAVAPLTSEPKASEA